MMIGVKRRRKLVAALVLISFFGTIFFTQYMDSPALESFTQRDTKPSLQSLKVRLRSDPEILLFVDSVITKLGQEISEELKSNRIKHKVEVASRSLPVLTNLDKGRYGVIVFENLDKYLSMDQQNRELLDKYCREYSVGIVGFMSPSEETLVGAQLKGFPLFVHTNLSLRDASLNPASPVLRLTKAGATALGPLPDNNWAVFQYNDSAYEPLEFAKKIEEGSPMTTVLVDHGKLDNIKRVFFGAGLNFWLHRLLLLDVLFYLSHGQISVSLNRKIMVDIDDIFVSEHETKLKPDDVEALVAAQNRMAEMIPGFRFNLGFCGKTFHNGTKEENSANDLLIEYRNEFTWFGHMWNHQQPHLYDNLTVLMNEMMLNKEFARAKGIPVDSGYSVSPHHSGVYPAHELLYTAWKKVWNVSVTSTTEYPHPLPFYLHRGFIHQNIKVLPRQSCGLFSYSINFDGFPGGRGRLESLINGGVVFQTIVRNQISVFMTHMPNYAKDRLAPYVFESIMNFTQRWTNLKISAAPPLQLADEYFKLYPEEKDPIWGNPCEDELLMLTWSRNKNCDSFPKFLVIGPQKTGTMALYSFLNMHPKIASNRLSPDSYEEVQFFNGNNYYRGLDWYIDFFRAKNTSYLFEKSATYFADKLVPQRAHQLLPNASIIAILVSPIQRAYSWYQHVLAHDDVTAKNYSFYQVITADDSASKPLLELRNGCLDPGDYAQHLERWLSFYSNQQLHIIDGEQLRNNPINVMNDLQRFLKVEPFMDYSNHLQFDPKKGFFAKS